MKPFDQIPDNETPRVQPLRAASGAWRTALLVSVGLHAVLLGWAVLHFSGQSVGARSVQLEGIEIEIISAAALESLMRAAVTDSGGGTAATTDVAGQAGPAPAEAAPQAAAPDVPQAITVITTPDADAHVAAVAPEQPQQTTAPATTAPATMATEAGGATTEATVPSPQQAAAAGAAPGEVARYAADVRRVLSRTRPKSGWPAGSVRVAFTVSDTGAVAHAEIVEPSRSALLDQRALAWVGATRFPVPPVGLSDSERTYAIPLTVTGPATATGRKS